MNKLITTLNILGYISTGVVVVTTVWAIFAWLRGILPAILRLGRGLAHRKITVFAKSDNLPSLINLLVDSKLFVRRNIIGITKKDDFGKSEVSTIFLAHWPDWLDEITEIADLKKDNDALIIYAPSSAGRMPEKVMSKLNEKRNVTIVNFRGRLLNDMVVAMITTGYKKGLI